MYRPGTQKFYKTVAFESVDNGYAILLDGRPVKTPMGLSLYAYNKSLAQQLIDEWAEQKETIDPDTMPMTALSCTMIDRIIPNRADVANQLIQFAEMDLVCYRAQDPKDLSLRQHSAWQPLIDWSAETFEAPLVVTDSILPASQPKEALKSLNVAINQLSHWECTALSVVSPVAGSLIVGLALIKGRIDVEEAMLIIQLDEDYQNENWGTVEEARQRQQNIRREIEAAATFVKYSNEYNKRLA